MAHIHTFADFDALPLQTAGLAYGPDGSNPEKIFKLTSGFNSLSVIKAFAVSRGLVFVQQQANNPLLCNLVLKPLEQTVRGILPIKYFIYRGLSISSFLDISLPNMLLAPSINLSVLLQKMYEDKPLILQLESKTLRFDSSPQPLYPDGMLIDEVFEEDNVNQLPVVEAGDSLGDFSTTHDFGFEIVLHTASFNPDMGMFRENYYKIDLTTIPNYPANPQDEGFNFKFMRETVNYFIDPAAFYGLHYDQKVVYHSGTITDNKTGEDIYTYILSKFDITKNKVYIQISNEHNHSFNYYDNYRNDSESYSKIKLGVGDNPTMVSEDYQTARWPIFIKEFTGSTNNTDDLELTFQLPIKDNLYPVLYCPQCLFKGDKQKKIQFRSLNRDTSTPTNWKLSESFILSFFNNNSKKSISSIIKISYNRILNTKYLDEIFETKTILPTIGFVIPQLTPFDNLVKPFDIKRSWESSLPVTSIPLGAPQYSIFWTNMPDKYYNCWIASGQLHNIYTQGIANDGIGEVAYIHIHTLNFAKSETEYSELKIPKNKNVHFSPNKITSAAYSFFEAYYLNIKMFLDFDSLITNKETDKLTIKPIDFNDFTITVNDVEKVILKLISGYEQATDMKDFILNSFAYTYEERKKIKDIIQASFDPYLPVYFIITDIVKDSTDDFDTDYIALRLGLCGICQEQIVKKETGIWLYSVDNANYCTLDYYEKLFTKLNNN